MTPPQIYGLIGYPVKHSLSQKMHNAAFKEYNINAEYRLFEIAPGNLEDFLLKDIQVRDIEGKPVFTAELSGFNITIPHKVKAKEILEKKFSPPHSEEIFHNVEISGAVNTVKINQNKLEYFNTDVSGFYRALKEDLGLDAKDARDVLLFGCGGAGRAVIACLSWKTYSVNNIYIYETNEESIRASKAHFENKNIPSSIAKKLKFIKKEEINDIIKKCQLLVNATPVGMRQEDFSIIDKNLLHNKLYVYDIVYNRETQLIKDARDICLNAKNGIGMLLHQGMIAFQLWTGKEAPKQVMLEALLKGLK